MNSALLIGALAFWLVAWAINEWLVRRKFANRTAARAARLAVPLLFGISILVLWEGLVRGLNVPSVLLPPPSMIWARLINSLPTLWADFRQTFLKAVITGYVLGCGLGFLVAIAIDRSPFLQKGLLPLGNFVSALPVIGVAPIMVMWFGFDWQSKVAVVVIMTFF
ncbi:MAG: ABC transporter permease, partial [Pararhizobium sp.]